MALEFISKIMWQSDQFLYWFYLPEENFYIASDLFNSMCLFFYGRMNNLLNKSNDKFQYSLKDLS